MAQVHFISNGQKILRCGTGQLECFLSQKDGDGNPVWQEVPDPNPPILSEKEILIHDHSGQIAVVHKESGKQTWCDKGQLEALLASGWKRLKESPVSEAPEAPAEPTVEAPAEPTAEEPAEEKSELRLKLEAVPRDDDKYWKSNGEVNITGLRELIPNVTRQEVNDAFPGFSRTA